jgi:hypothetical protein
MRKLERHSTRVRLLLVVAAAAIVGSLAVGLSRVTSGSSAVVPPGMSFAAVSASTLASEGIVLTQPSATPAVPRASADAMAQTLFPGRAVREAQFVHCLVSNITPAIDQDCWAYSLDPSGFHSHGPSSSTPIPATYLVALIDPASGKLLMAEAGAP